MLHMNADNFTLPSYPVTNATETIATQFLHESGAPKWTGVFDELSKLILPHSLAWPSLDLLEPHLIPGIWPYYQCNLLTRALLESYCLAEELEAKLALPSCIHLQTISNPAHFLSKEVSPPMDKLRKQSNALLWYACSFAR